MMNQRIKVVHRRRPGESKAVVGEGAALRTRAMRCSSNVRLDQGRISPLNLSGSISIVSART